MKGNGKDEQLLATCRDLYLKLSAKHFTNKEILSVFKKFLQKQKNGEIDIHNFSEYKDYVMGKVNEALGFEA